MADNKGYFKLLKKTNLMELNENEIIPQSDFSAIENGYLIQLEYKEPEQDSEKYPVHPGIYTIIKNFDGLKLEKASFSKDKILTSYSHTQLVLQRISKFFTRLSIFKKHGIEIPVWRVLFYGGQGLGKTKAIIEAAESYVKQGDTLVVLWKTDVFESHYVKDFIKSFEYKGVKKFILIAEDLGGIEIDQAKMPSKSSLLALLDNSEKAFTIPTLVLATTNFPEMFLANLADRPERFDDKIEMPKPTTEVRVELYKFFVGEKDTPVSEEVIEEIRSDKYKDFSIAHIRNIVLKADLYEWSHLEAMKQILEEQKKYKNMFQNKAKLGFNVGNDYE